MVLILGLGKIDPKKVLLFDQTAMDCQKMTVIPSFGLQGMKIVQNLGRADLIALGYRTMTVLCFDHLGKTSLMLVLFDLMDFRMMKVSLKFGHLEIVLMRGRVEIVHFGLGTTNQMTAKDLADRIAMDCQRMKVIPSFDFRGMEIVQKLGRVDLMGLNQMRVVSSALQGKIDRVDPMELNQMRVVVGPMLGYQMDLNQKKVFLADQIAMDCQKMKAILSSVLQGMKIVLK
jgi:hypothetical protein